MDWFLALSAAEKTYFIIAAVASIFLVSFLRWAAGAVLPLRPRLATISGRPF